MALRLLRLVTVLALAGCGRSTLAGTAGFGSSAANLTMLASGQHAPVAIAVDAENVYWTNEGYGGGDEGSVMHVPIGGGSVTTLASNQTVPAGIAVGAGNVYWIDLGWNGSAGAVMSVPIGGGPARTLGSVGEYSDSIAVNATGVFWTAYSVIEAPFDGGPFVTACVGCSSPFAVDASSIYWDADGWIESALIANPDGYGTFLCADHSPLGYVAAIAVDAANLYWMSTSDGVSYAVQQVPIDGGSATVLVSGRPAPVGFAVDGIHVYWSEQGLAENSYAGTVMDVPVGGGEVVTLAAAAQSQPTGLAVDATSVYWTDSLAGTVVKLAK